MKRKSDGGNYLNYILKDNRGTTLLLAIIAMCFIAILGSIILSLTMTNIQMKQIDYHSKTNFYSSEKTLEKLKAGLEETSSSCLYKAYQDLLHNYVTINSDPAKTLDGEFEKFYLKYLTEALTGTTITNLNVAASYYYKGSILKSLVASSGAIQNVDDGEGDNILVVHLDTSKPENVNSVTLKNVTLKYTDGQGFETTIRTDINLAAPHLNFDTASVYPEYTRYSLIADKKLFINNPTGLNINGNVYAGADGISINGSYNATVSPDSSNPANYNLKMINGTIVTRGDITLDGTGVVFLGTKDNPSSIWAENIKTQKNSTSTGISYLNLYGNIRVSDDLMLGAENSQVSVGGTYYGYTFNEMVKELNDKIATGSITGPALNLNRSSAILVNGLNSTLDMSGVNSMTIAGSAFVSRGAVATNPDIRMGESISVKSNQIAYLVPNGYIRFGHNPVSAEEYYTAVANNLSIVNMGDDYKDLLTTGKYTTYFCNIAGVNMVYLYLDFKDQKSANQYFYNYYSDSELKDSLNSSAKSYLPNGVILNNALILAAYATKGSNFDLSQGTLTNPDTVNDTYKVLYNDAVRTAMEYKSRQLELDSISAEATSSDFRLLDKNSSPLFQTIMKQKKDNNGIDVSVISEEAREAGAPNQYGFNNYGIGGTRIKQVKVETGSESYYVTLVYNPSEPLVIDDTLLSTADMKKGIIVATGDVSVDCTYTYEGLIISGGTITVSKSNLTITSNPNIVQQIISKAKDLEQIDWKTDKSKQFTHYFAAYAGSTDENSQTIDQVDISDYITYENWTKNKN